MLWKNFRDLFSERFAVSHDAVMRSHYLQEKFDEIQRSDEWWEFENLSSLKIVEPRHWKAAKAICREFRQLDCRFDIREMLRIHPFSACSFSLARKDYWENLPVRLSEIIKTGLASYGRTLKALSETILPMLREILDKIDDRETLNAASNLIEMMNDERAIGSFSTRELQILRKIFETSSAKELIIEISPDSVVVMHEHGDSAHMGSRTEEFSDQAMLSGR